jgi:hypothetical protein
MRDEHLAGAGFAKDDAWLRRDDTGDGRVVGAIRAAHGIASVSGESHDRAGGRGLSRVHRLGHVLIFRGDVAADGHIADDVELGGGDVVCSCASGDRLILI